VTVLPVAAVEFGQLLKVIWVSLAAGLIVTTAFALVVRSTARAADARRSGDGGTAVLHGTLATIFFLAFCAIVVFGLVIMLKK
jgi:hypothetical protein